MHCLRLKMRNDPPSLAHSSTSPSSRPPLKYDLSPAPPAISSRPPSASPPPLSSFLTPHLQTSRRQWCYRVGSV
ncbi:hypothetical protein AAHA92_29980 [Salvia divinorum]|uniref:Uncharacterized protein n=1 Tax=Salvia divinorum TaxID=28513 RepID=A0ABD1G049_SALDI